MKTPIQAYTDTLPQKLKDAILNHQVWVGMSTDMVLFAKGQPDGKTREMDGQMPFEEWIYGKPPQTVEFVRVNGNRVIRVEIAKTGEEPTIFTKDQVEGLMRTDGTPLDPAAEPRVAKNGDVQRDPNTQEAAPPPSLKKPGETLPDQDQNAPRLGDMRRPGAIPCTEARQRSRETIRMGSRRQRHRLRRPALLSLMLRSRAHRLIPRNSQRGRSGRSAGNRRQQLRRRRSRWCKTVQPRSTAEAGRRESRLL